MTREQHLYEEMLNKYNNPQYIAAKPLIKNAAFGTLAFWIMGSIAVAVPFYLLFLFIA